MASIAGLHHNRTSIVSAIAKAIAANASSAISSRLAQRPSPAVGVNATQPPLIGGPQSSDEFFRLYASRDPDESADMDGDDMDMDDLDLDLSLPDGGEDDDDGKFIVGQFNPFGNLTTGMNDTLLGGNDTAATGNEQDAASTVQAIAGDLSSYFVELNGEATTELDDDAEWLELTTTTRPLEEAADTHVFSTLAQTVTESVLSALGPRQQTQPHHPQLPHHLGSNYGDVAEDDIALIESAEVGDGLDGDETDYGAAGEEAGGGGGGGLLRQTISFEMGSRTRNDSSFYPNFDGGGAGAGGAGGGRNSVFVGNGVVGDRNDNSGSIFTLRFENFGEYFYNFNNSSGALGGPTSMSTNLSDLYKANCTNATICEEPTEVYHNYWALILILFPILTLFGNILVILSVCRERSLQTVTNYFIVSLAIADLLVAVVVMPFAVYVLFNGVWALPNVVCDFYIAMDVICSTSSIFNLVAISIDRYIAVTQPIKYAKHRNSRRVCLTILLVWAISAAIGSPIVLGLNNTPYRDPDLCAFYNTDFILYSSLSSFYIPCIIMVFLYYNIFKALRNRARKQRAARKPHLSELTGGSVIENVAQTRRLAETALDNSRHASRIIPDEAATNTASGSNEEEDENAISPDIDDCHVIVNDKSTEFMLATVVEETGNVVAQITTQPQLVVADPNGNHDSGYAPSNVDDVLAGAADSSPPDSPVASGTTLKRSSVSSTRRSTAAADTGSPKRQPPTLSVAMKPLSFVRCGVQEAMTLARNDSTLSTTSKTSSRKDKKNSQASRFTIYKVHKASKKKREKSSAKKERKATKTLAIVLGVFLFCWVPFFTCNIMDALCSKLKKDCNPGVTAFMLTTWLGYINSFVNPVIYTIFNPEFRKAFKKIMHMG